MLHCPFCSTDVKENEVYCIKCGKELPIDMFERVKKERGFNKYWYLPFFLAIFFIISISIFNILLKNNSTSAKDLYEDAESYLLEEDYEEARDLFQQSLDHKSNFKEATVSVEFMDDLFLTQDEIDDALLLLDDQEYQEALDLINESESKLSNYQGTAATILIDEIESTRNTIKIAQLVEKLDGDPSIEDLKLLLWDAEAINDPEAEEITSTIRMQIVDYVFSLANEELNNNQFKNALALVDDGLKYAPDSEKLQSLKTTVNKEQTTFETVQQERIEKAINMATKEEELNKNNAIKLEDVDLMTDKQDNVVIEGEVTSNATIPLTSIHVEYEIMNKDGDELVENKVFVYPEKLYPKENGKFEFTHYDLDEDVKNLEVNIDKITWYTD